MGKKHELDFSSYSVSTMLAELESVVRRRRTNIRVLQFVDMEEGDIPPVLYQHLRTMNWLRDVTVIGEEIKPEHFFPAIRGALLRSCWFTGVPVTQEQIEYLNSQELMRLSIQVESEIDLARCQILHDVSLSGSCALGEKTAQGIGAARKLRLNEVAPTPEFLSQLRLNYHLRQVDIGACELESCPEVVSQMGQVVNLEQLVIEDFPSGTSQDEVDTLLGLRFLHLVRMKSLETLPQLQRLSTLRKLFVTAPTTLAQNRDFQPAIDELRRALPKCRIQAYGSI